MFELNNFIYFQKKVMKSVGLSLVLKDFTTELVLVSLFGLKCGDHRQLKELYCPVLIFQNHIAVGGSKPD